MKPPQAPAWQELVGGRCLVRPNKPDESNSDVVLEVVVVEVTPSNSHVKVTVIMAMQSIWVPANFYALVELLPVQSDIAKALESWRICERLRNDDHLGASVHLLCDNEDGNGPDNCAVEIHTDLTQWEAKRFYGQTVLDALTAAAAFVDAQHKGNPLHRPILKQQ